MQSLGRVHARPSLESPWISVGSTAVASDKPDDILRTTSIHTSSTHHSHSLLYHHPFKVTHYLLNLPFSFGPSPKSHQQQSLQQNTIAAQNHTPSHHVRKVQHSVGPHRARRAPRRRHSASMHDRSRKVRDSSSKIGRGGSLTTHQHAAQPRRSSSSL